MYCKPEFNGDGHNFTGTEQISVHDSLSCKRQKFSKLAKTESMCMVTWISLSPLFSISFTIRDHVHRYALSIAFQTLMNVLTIYTTVARTTQIVQTSWDHTTVLVMLDLLEMDTSAMVRSSTAFLI